MTEHTETKAPRRLQKCYELNRVIFLPHYTMPSWFVQPGMKLNNLNHDELVNVLITEKELQDRGATQIFMNLWHRPSIDLKGI